MSRDSRSQSGMIFPSGLKDAITYTRFVIIDHLRFIIQTYVRKINRENSDFGDLNENTNLLAHGLSPTDYDLLNWATDNPFRRQIWKITDRNMTGTPDDTKEWCCLNFQDSDHSRGVIMAIEYGMGTRICTRIYYNKEWLTEWASLRN